MRTNFVKFTNLTLRKSLNHSVLRAVLMVLLIACGVGNAWGWHSTHTATLKVDKGTGDGSVYAATTDNATSGSTSASFNCGASEDGQHTGTLYAYATPASGYTFKGWTTSRNSSEGANSANPMGVAFDVTDASSTLTYYAHFVEKAKVNITFIAPTNGTYTIAVNGGGAETVSFADVVKSNVTDVTLIASPTSGYAFAGWYRLNSSGDFEEDLSIASPYDASFTAAATIKIGARFVPTTLGKFILKGGSTEYYGLKAATVAAGGSGTIVPVAEETVVDGSDLLSFDNGKYTIKTGATLLVPYNSSNTVQTKPAIVRPEAALSIYKKLILTSGVDIQCYGTICVGGQIMSGGGGYPTGYVTGDCGVIDMSNGGHIELNEKAKLYAWGFIKGQDMDQGNNTVGVGTITANSGTEVWEDLAFGDWRGGTATKDIYNAGDRFFPFQTYFVQNIEVPLSIKHGAYDYCYSVLYASSSNYDISATMIGNSGALFKLEDDNALVRKWYDPTTDLLCYELSGSANLDAITISGLPLIGSITSSGFDLPISSNMHIILRNSNVIISKPMVMHAGAKIEITVGSNITLSTKIYMYDKDDWGPYAGPNYYFHNYGYTYGILTSHKNRGDGKSNAGLDDAQFIVDGTLTISSSGALYTSAGGADVMGYGGGRAIFQASSLPSNTTIAAYTGNGDKVSGGTSVKSANLHNEDESYTKAIATKTFLNIHGRWFNQTDGASSIKADHTYDFTYISSGAVSGTEGTSTTTDAVYSWDKTGLEARMKWANVTQYTCPYNSSDKNWWNGQGAQSTWFYNWTLNSDWHQFMPSYRRHV